MKTPNPQTLSRFIRLMALGIITVFIVAGCHRKHQDIQAPEEVTMRDTAPPPVQPTFTDPFQNPVTLGRYFVTMDSIVLHYDTLTVYPLSEHLIVHANPWIIDSLAATDYYEMMDRGVFVEDTRTLVMVHEGDSLLIPDSLYAAQLQEMLDSIQIDVNVPEYRLRIHTNGDTILSIPIRVGQNRSRYLKLAGRTVSLQTDLGTGTIIRADRDPYFLNPVDGKHFTRTRRDDGLVTEMPPIPWIETELNGIRTGDMIHPTTNLKTLGKAYSNGCIGTRESDAWRIYYYAPLGTRIVVRYDLEVVLPEGDTLILKDIYNLKPGGES